jgi:DNA-binding helix-hairpin-helix protein with protein kinase domain
MTRCPEGHFYDPARHTACPWCALPADAGLVYLNGDIVNAPAQMKADDILEVGQPKLVLVPFLGDRYSWSNEAARGEG